MPIFSGFAALLQSALPDTTNVFGVMLPQNWLSATNPTAVSIKSIISTPLYVFEGQDPLIRRTFQIDCEGFALSDADTTANLIDNFLSGGWRGTLSDGTLVLSIIRLPTWIEGYRDSDRTFCISLEYVVTYVVLSILYTYFIDPIHGNDSNSGTSTTNAFLTTTRSDEISLTGNQTIGYLYSGTWYLYRETGMTMNQDLLPANLITAAMNTF